MDSGGQYPLQTGKAFGPAKPLWHYEAKNKKDFFSSEISGAHRLPNGNTLICAGVIGNLFEVTAAGDVVWQYVNPMVRGGILRRERSPAKMCVDIFSMRCSRYTVMSQTTRACWDAI